jgi:hypothetical protein
MAESKQVSRDLSEISLEDLMNVEVTSVSKKEQKLSQTAASGAVANGSGTSRWAH